MASWVDIIDASGQKRTLFVISEDVIPESEEQTKRYNQIADRFLPIFTAISAKTWKQFFGFDEADKRPAVVYTAFPTLDHAEKAVAYLQDEHKTGINKAAVDKFCWMGKNTQTRPLKTEKQLTPFLTRPYYRSCYGKACALTKPHKFVWWMEIYYNSNGDCFPLINVKENSDEETKAQDQKAQVQYWDKRTEQAVAEKPV